MPDDPLAAIQLLIARDAYDIGEHVEMALALGKYELCDIETAILHGRIRRTKRDKLGGAVDGNVYVIRGPDHSGLAFDTVGKIVEGLDGQAYFLITAYALRMQGDSDA